MTFMLPGGLVDAHVHLALDFAGHETSRAELIELNRAALVEIGGLSPEEALEAASTVARRVLDLPIPEGDVVTYAADPREDIGVLAAPLRVDVG